MHFWNYGNLLHWMEKMVNMIDCHYSVSPLHGSVGNKNAAMKILVIWNLQEHFNVLKNVPMVLGTEIAWEMIGQVTSCDNNTKRVYLPSWMNKRGCCKSYCSNQWYDVEDHNCNNVIDTWIGLPENEPKLKSVATWNDFVTTRKNVRERWW